MAVTPRRPALPRPVPPAVPALLLALCLGWAGAPPATAQQEGPPPDSEPRPVVEPEPPSSEPPPSQPPPSQHPSAEPLAPDVVDRVDPLLPEDGEAADPVDPDRFRAGVPGRAPILRAIEIRSDTPLAKESLQDMESTLGFEIGEPLTEEAVARALRNVQASGLASRVDVYVRPAPAGETVPGRPGVVAEVVLRANLVVESVRVEGDTGELSAEELRKAVPQQAGEPLIESRLVRGVYQMQEELRRAGYFEAVVRLAPEIDEERNRARVLYRVEAGPRAQVADVRFQGDLGPFTGEELRQPMRLMVGGPYRQAVARRDTERLERWLVGEGYRTARVDRPVEEYRPDGDSVVMTYGLAVGPKVTVEVRGAELKKLRKRDLLPFLGEEGFDEALLLLAENRLRSYYQGQGHYRVRVEVREERQDGELRVVVEVDPGPVFTVRTVDFVGNEDFSDERLAELVATQPTSLLTRLPVVGGGGRLVEETLSDDVSNLQAFYALQGYVDAEVGPPDVAVVGEEDALAVTIPIAEGEQQKVVGVTLSGVEAFGEDELLDEMVIQEGGPFHPRILETSLDQLRARYEREGYDAVNVSANTAWNPAHTLALVTIRVLEGPQTVVDRVIVRGNQRTHAEVIRRAIDLDPGEPVSRSRLLEAERSLYRLGLFSQVELELTPAPLGATTRDVVVRVAEGLVRSVRYGVSVEYNDQVTDWSYGGSVGFTHANVLGRGITLSADARILSEEEQFRLFVEQPTVGDLDVPLTYSLFSVEERRAGFRISRDGARVEGRRRLGEDTQLGLAYDYRIVENRPLEDAPGDLVAPDGEDLERRDQTLRVAGFIPTLIHDRSDDPVNPTDGYTSLAQLQYAFPLFDAEADFVKLFLQHTHYVDLDFAILAASARFGGIEALSPLPAGVVDPVIPSELDLPSQEIFLAERFFAGGGSSHRGYRPDELGIPFATCLPGGGGAGGGGGGPVADDCAATLFPGADGELREAGGNGLALVNLDLRFPLFGTVEGVVFFDFGNVWADWRQIDLADFRTGTGAELRYLSPVGPLRLGVGVPLDPYPGADDYVFYVSLGSPF